MSTSLSRPLVTGYEDADVIVAGAGFGGLIAAATAAQRGKRVLLIEAAAQAGGTVALSSGLMHMYDAPNWEAFQKTFPTVNAELGAAMYERFPEMVEWLRQTVKLPMTKVPLPVDPYKDASRVPGGYVLGLPDWLWVAQPILKPLSEFGYKLLGEAYLFALDRLIIRPVRGQVANKIWSAAEASGARVALRSRVRSIKRAGDGRFEVISDAPIGTLVATAPKVILATGGFQGSTKLLREHMGEGAAKALCRAVETNRGDGLELGMSLGGTQVGPMDRFYGYPMAALPKEIDRERDAIALLNCSAYYASTAILLDRSGRRFVDEPAAGKNSEVAHAMIQLANGECWAVLDQPMRDRAGYRGFGAGLLPPMDLLRNSKRRGADLLVANTIEELAQALGAAGVDGEQAARTIAAYNEAALTKTAGNLQPARSSGADALSTPPFYALRLVPGVSLTYGGLRINARAQLLDESGAPIAGVFAVPGLAGGLYTRQYGGALAACGTFGRIAGSEAAS